MLAYKRIIAAYLCIIMLFSLFSCGEYKPGVGIGQGNNNQGNTGGDAVMDDDPTKDFTVQLRANEEIFRPQTAIDILRRLGVR